MATASDTALYVGQWNSDGWHHASQLQDVDTIISETGHLFKDVRRFDHITLDCRVP